MKVFVLGNGELAAEAVRHIREQGDEVVGLALHPPARRRAGARILAAAGLAEGGGEGSGQGSGEARLFDGSRLAEAAEVERVRALGAELAVSVLFGYLLRPELLAVFPRGAVNLHLSYLPWNRGAHPNVWSLVDGTPAGVTLHRIDAGMDTGPILRQQPVEVEPVDTAETLYGKLLAAAGALFATAWGPLVRGELTERPQEPGAGNTHRVRDLQRLDVLDLDRATTARQVIDQLRARTFPPHRGACFTDAAGRRVEVRVELAYADDTADDEPASGEEP